MNNHSLGLAGAAMIGILAASQPALANPSGLTPPADNVAVPQQTYLLVELLGPAKMIGYPAVCPGSSPDEDQSEIMCLAELYEAPARVIQQLDGAKTARRLNIRFTAHSFYAVWQKDVRLLVGVAPFEDKGRTGHFAFFWDWEDSNGEFCKGEGELDDFAPPVRDFYFSGRMRKAGPRNEDWEPGWDIACAKGRPGRGR